MKICAFLKRFRLIVLSIWYNMTRILGGKNMIDIHTHLLPGLDDGSSDLEESLTMLKAMAENGVTDLFLTSHVAPRRGFLNDKLTLQEAFLSFKEQAKAIPVNLYLGSEIDQEKDLESLLEVSPTMNETSFVMIDFGMRKVDIEDIVYELKIKGYKVIIAHPERYFYTSYEDLVHLKKQGVFFQVSAPHLVKEGSKEAQKKALRLLKEDLIDFIGSDTHHTGNEDVMARAYKVVQKKKDEETAQKLFYENAKKHLINHS